MYQNSCEGSISEYPVFSRVLCFFATLFHLNLRSDCLINFDSFTTTLFPRPCHLLFSFSSTILLPMSLGTFFPDPSLYLWFFPPLQPGRNRHKMFRSPNLLHPLPRVLAVFFSPCFRPPTTDFHYATTQVQIIPPRFEPDHCHDSFSPSFLPSSF